MLFDLGGKRKRVVQVVFGLLAALFAITFVGFGIGSDASGGIFDALGLSSDTATQDADPIYDNQIARAEEALSSNPKDEKALLGLAEAHFLKGQAMREQDANGALAPPGEESLSEYSEAIKAWERYMATNPEKPDERVATLISQAYGARIEDASSFKEQFELYKGAAEASRIVAQANPGIGTLVPAAQLSYLVGETKTAEELEKQALAEAADATQRKQLQKTFAVARQQNQAVQQALAQERKAEKASTPDKGQLENPLEGFGPGSSTPVPGIPGTPPGGTAPTSP